MYIGAKLIRHNDGSDTYQYIGVGHTEADTKWALIRYYLDEMHTGEVPQVLKDSLKARNIDAALKIVRTIAPQHVSFFITSVPVFSRTDGFDLEPTESEYSTEPGVVTHNEGDGWYEVQSRVTQEYHSVHATSFHSDFPNQTLMPGATVNLVFRKRAKGRVLMLTTRKL